VASTVERADTGMARVLAIRLDLSHRLRISMALRSTETSFSCRPEHQGALREGLPAMAREEERTVARQTQRIRGAS
jgi:hypothetical protein